MPIGRSHFSALLRRDKVVDMKTVSRFDYVTRLNRQFTTNFVVKFMFLMTKRLALIVIFSPA